MPAQPHIILSSNDKDATAVLAELLKPGARIPPGICAVAPDFPNRFSTPIRMLGISWCKRKNAPLTLLLLEKLEVHPDAATSGTGDRLYATRARANAGGSFRGHDPKICANAK